MSTKKLSTRIKITPPPKKRRRGGSQRERRILWLAQDIFTKAIHIPSTEEHTTKTLALASFGAAKVFWSVADPVTKRKR